ncbi:MAG TPA: type II secretion system F family protein [Firmicutes bacterium]|jgi:general secretion pathway protein F|nr:type II secretion system F family protein [Bacillota bacterium]HOQ24670.1 type II secretion system F family protein [Bacillota bacterium]HPT68158.1 type II secretion system F family protein [Bacillota bacterium]
MEFYYRAVQRNGTIVSGQRTARTKEQLLAALKSEGLLPLEVRVKAERVLPLFSRVSGRELLAFTQQMAGLLQAGIRLNRALEIITDLARGRLRLTITQIQQDLNEGLAFSAALEKHPSVFNSAYVAMVRAGESAGLLPEVMARLASSMEQEQDFKGQVITSLMYPFLVTFVSIVAVIFMLTNLVPRFQTVFKQLGQELPAITAIVLAISGFLTRYGLFLLIVLVLGIVLLIRLFRSSAFKDRLDRWLLGLPLVGKIIIQVETERFTRILSMLMRSGVPLLNCLLILSAVMGNGHLRQALTDAANSVKAGEGLARCLGDKAIFPSMLVAMIGVGEEGGNLDEMMEEVAKVYARETRQSIQRIISMVGPVMTLGLAGLIFLIALAILLPIFQLNIMG